MVDIGSRGYEGVGGIVTDNYKYSELESNLLLTVNHDSARRSASPVSLDKVSTSVHLQELFQGKHIIAPGIYDLNNTLNVVPYGGGITKRRLVGLFGDITVGWDNYLYLNVLPDVTTGHQPLLRK